MMKILYVITGLGLGGAEKVVVALAEQMNLLGHEVKIAYLKGDAIVKPQSTDIELIALGLEGVTQLISASKKYKTLLKEFKPDVVHAHMVHANIFTRILRGFISVPRLICTAHSNNEGGRLRMLAYKVTHSWADLTTNVSQSASESFERLGAVSKGEMKTVYNGIDLNKFIFKPTVSKSIKAELNIKENTVIFLAVGRMHEAKDYPNLLNSFSMLKYKLNNKVKLLIAGDGQLTSEIMQLINDLKLGDDVDLLGRRDDIPDLLSLSDFYILSSKYEGLPTVVIEAMACRCYVIATDCGGSAEILGDTGQLVPIQNSEALAEAMENALNLEKHDIERNNQKARLRVEEKFSLESSVQNWLEIYAAK